MKESLESSGSLEGSTEGMDDQYTWWSSKEPEPTHLQEFALCLFFNLSKQCKL